MANQSYTYDLVAGKSVSGLISAVDTYLSDTEKMETQRVSDEGGGYVALQARVKGGNWKQVIGMDKAITIRFIKETWNSVRMEIGEAKWIDKGGIMLLSMFVLWPLTITSGIGMYKQGSLPGKIRGVADEYTGVTSKEVAEKEWAAAERKIGWEKAAGDLEKTVNYVAIKCEKLAPKIMDSIAKMIRF